MSCGPLNSLQSFRPITTRDSEIQPDTRHVGSQTAASQSQGASSRGACPIAHNLHLFPFQNCLTTPNYGKLKLAQRQTFRLATRTLQSRSPLSKQSFRTAPGYATCSLRTCYTSFCLIPSRLSLTHSIYLRAAMGATQTWQYWFHCLGPFPRARLQSLVFVSSSVFHSDRWFSMHLLSTRLSLSSLADRSFSFLPLLP